MTKDFLFTVKLWQKFTHPKMYEKATGEEAVISQQDIDVFKRSIEPLYQSGKLGTVLAQLPPSFKNERSLLAAVTTGIIWGVLYYPINLREYNFPEHPILGLLVFPISTVMLSIIFGWLRLCSGSVWSACLAHDAINSIGGSLTMLLFLGGPDLLFTSYLGLLGWIPLGALCLWIILTGRMKPEKVSNSHS